ncbi:MAG: fused MFS/spermidine synthase [Akkermansiaceae bacterium]
MSQSKRGIFYLMVFFSGFAGLLYQILWMRQLGLLLGNTSYAAAITLGIFFLGLATGSWFWGNRCARLPKLLHTYACLELGIAVSGIFFLAVLNYFHRLYPTIYQSVGPGTNLLILKSLLTLLMVFPPSFFMGGTIPVLGQFLIRTQTSFGNTAAKIYGINTIGAAAGAFITGFFLIILLGFKLTCFLGIFISLAIALVSFLIARRPETAVAEAAVVEPEQKSNSSKKSVSKKKEVAEPVVEQAKAASRFVIYAFAFISGFNVLALEVLWTRMFAQVHENSVYSFSAVLIVILICLALGALFASWLAKRSAHPIKTLFFLMILSGIGVAISPFIFSSITDKLQMIPTNVSFANYIWNLFKTGFATIGLPCLVLGTVFPFLMKSEERYADQPGKSIGALSAINTIGASLGAMICGFLLLQFLGMWRSVQIIAASYFIIALIMPTEKSTTLGATKILTAFIFIVCLTILNPNNLPVTGTVDAAEPETIVEVWEASDGTVSVVQSNTAGHSIKVNSGYSLGSTSSRISQILQTRIPLLIYPETESIFYLGMGTGATAGEALNKQEFRNIKEVTVCELLPDVVKASKKYMTGKVDNTDYTNGLFSDPRAKVIVEDGRNHLMATDKKFDMINADLFIPYHRGTGSLYSLEHYQSAKKRLNPDGVYVQWLPLYQISEYEFGVITKTMLSAFNQVTLWRHNFQPGAEIAALIGHQDKSKLPTDELFEKNISRQPISDTDVNAVQHLHLPSQRDILFFYCGNVTASRSLFDNYPINTDDKPIIEYKTPISLHHVTGKGTQKFVANQFSDLVDKLLDKTPPASDPILAGQNPQNKNLPLAGAAFHKVYISLDPNDHSKADQHWQTFQKNWIEGNRVLKE